MFWQRHDMARGLLVGVTAVLLATCVNRPIELDVGEEVERVCVMMCEQNVACHAPPLFETVDECVEQCADADSLHATDSCGVARRAVYECIGATTTCEAYLDTNNVHADEYTCKAEKDAMVDECLP